jgi:hypothetical protein
MPERNNRYGGEDPGQRGWRERDPENRWERGRQEGWPGESGQSGAWRGADQSGYGHPAWEYPGRGAGSHPPGGGWDLDDGRVQSARGTQAWQGPGREGQSGAGQSGHGAADNQGLGYGQGGYGGYGSSAHAAQAYGPHGQHGGGYGSEASYGNQGPNVGYAHRGGQGGHAQYGAQGDAPQYPAQGRRPGYGSYASQGYVRHDAGYGTELDPPERTLRSVMREAWMGEGYGGPTHHVAPEPGDARQRWPKSYTRSDDRIREDLYERVMRHDYIDASDLVIVVAQGVVTLDGSVPERHMKHDIENIADACPGVKDIENRIRVNRPGTPATSQAASQPQGSEPASQAQGSGQPASQAWGRSTGANVEDHGNRTTGGAMGYSGNTNTVAPSGLPGGTTGKPK